MSDGDGRILWQTSSWHLIKRLAFASAFSFIQVFQDEEHYGRTGFIPLYVSSSSFLSSTLLYSFVYAAKHNPTQDPGKFVAAGSAGAYRPVGSASGPQSSQATYVSTQVRTHPASQADWFDLHSYIFSPLTLFFLSNKGHRQASCCWLWRWIPSYQQCFWSSSLGCYLCLNSGKSSIFMCCCDLVVFVVLLLL